MPRLLACYDCELLIPVPDVAPGTLPEDDHVLDSLVQRHQHTDIPEARLKGGQLFNCDTDTWKKLGGPEGVLTHMRSELRKNQHEIKEFRDELGDDAMKCFNQHHRPQEGCIDYEDDSKALGSLAKVTPRSKRQYLCHYCPVQSWVTTQIRWKKGLYE